MKIGILICGLVREELVPAHGDYGGFFRRLLADNDFEFVDYTVVEEDFPKRLDECDAYILTGSAHGAYENHSFIPPLEAFIRQAYERSVPLIGICFGHQILAQALGGKVVKFDGGWGLGVHTYEIDFGSGPRDIKLNAVHQDQVVEVPKDARVIGHSPFCQNAVLSYGDRAISCQPHPEFEADFMKDLITLRKGKSFTDEIGDNALDSLNTPVANAEISAFFKAFLNRARLKNVA